MGWTSTREVLARSSVMKPVLSASPHRESYHQVVPHPLICKRLTGLASGWVCCKSGRETLIV